MSQFSHLFPGFSYGANAVFRPPLCWGDEVEIIGSEILLNCQNVHSGVYATAFLTIDVGGRHVASTGFPASENCAASDPFCRENLHRLCELVVFPNGPLFQRRDFKPVTCSRSRGDIFIFEGVGSGSFPGAQFFPGVHIIGDAIPNSEAINGFGTKSTASSGTDGRTVSTTYGPNFSIKFTAPASHSLSGIRFRVLANRTQGSCSARLYAADGTTPIDAAGVSQIVLGAGDYQLQVVGNITSGTQYVINVTTGGLDADLEVCTHVSGYTSMRATSTLPNLDDWRVDII